MNSWDALTYLVVHAGGKVTFRQESGESFMAVESDDTQLVAAYEAIAVQLGGSR